MTARSAVFEQDLQLARDCSTLRRDRTIRLRTVMTMTISSTITMYGGIGSDGFAK